MKHGICLAAILVFAACKASQSSSSAPNATFTSADSSAVVAVIDRLPVAAKAGDWDGWMAEYTADPVRLPPHAKELVGKAAADSFNRTFPKLPTFDVKIESLNGSGDLAVTSGTFALAAPPGKDASGKNTPAINDQGKFMTVLHKQPDGRWKISRDIWNSSLPLPIAASK